MTYGVFQAGNSVAHRLDPRTKLLVALVYLVSAFLAQSWAALGVVAVCAMGMLAAGSVRPGESWRMIRPFVPLLVFVLLFDVLFVNAGEVLIQAGILCVSVGGIVFALQSVLRFVCVLVGTGVLMRVTSPTALMDGIALLLRPLARLYVPVDDVALVCGMTLRFVPVFLEEYRTIRAAQEARLARFDGGVRKRLRRFSSVLVPLTMRTFRAAEQLSWALANREYAAHQVRRTCIREYHLAGRDGVALGMSVVLLVLCIIL